MYSRFPLNFSQISDEIQHTCEVRKKRDFTFVNRLQKTPQHPFKEDHYHGTYNQYKRIIIKRSKKSQ